MLDLIFSCPEYKFTPWFTDNKSNAILASSKYVVANAMNKSLYLQLKQSLMNYLRMISRYRLYDLKAAIISFMSIMDQISELHNEQESYSLILKAGEAARQISEKSHGVKGSEQLTEFMNKFADDVKMNMAEQGPIIQEFDPSAFGIHFDNNTKKHLNELEMSLGRYLDIPNKSQWVKQAFPESTVNTLLQTMYDLENPNQGTKTVLEQFIKTLDHFVENVLKPYYQRSYADKEMIFSNEINIIADLINTMESVIESVKATAN